MNEAFKKGFEFFFDNSAHIEIINGKMIERIDFIKLPFAHEIPKSLKNKFHDNVTIDSVKTKAKDLIKFTSTVILTCKHEEKFYFNWLSYF